MNTRKIFIITASIALGLHLTGCLSWRSADSFELQYDPDDYMRLVRSLMKKAKYPADLKVTNDVEYYHAQSGNTYHITKLHIVHSNEQVSDSKVIVKMSKMVFQKTKVK